MSQPLSAAASSTRRPRISIVGAGIAGLCLAAHLQYLRIPFSIYEARNADTIGHGYAVTLHSRRSWRHLLRDLTGDASSKSIKSFRQAVAVDRIINGEGRVSDSSKAGSTAFQAIDRDVRQWLVQRLSEKGVRIQWGHKLASIKSAGDHRGAELSFDGQGTAEADIIVDAGGLRAPCFDFDINEPTQPRLLPYATYYGTRRVTSSDFQDKYAHYFREGNSIELVSDEPHIPYVYLQKIHMPSDNPNNHTVELRWVYSRPPLDGNDLLYRPNRTPGEAKIIPDAFYAEVKESIQQFSQKKRSMLTDFFAYEDLRGDRILNWHLRVRLPTQQYLASNSDKGSYQVIAIGDAAHGLPIVKSSGANIATKDAKAAAHWIQKVFSADNKPGDVNFYDSAAETRYEQWFRSTQHAIQTLRAVHGQEKLTQAEMQEAIGFWYESALEVEQDSSGSDGEDFSSSDAEGVTSSNKGKL